MKQTNTILAYLFFAAVIFAASGQMFHACGQNAAPAQPTSPEQKAAKIKERWSKSLGDARLDFQNSNDRESVDFVTKMLDSFERPERCSSWSHLLGWTLVENRRQAIYDRAANLSSREA
jgi:hypothetical protein